MDLKSFNEETYKRHTGAHLEPVLDTLKYIKHETDVWLEVTTLLIPGLNDSDEELTAMAAWMARELGPDVPWHFSAFHPDYRMLDRPPTPPAILKRAREIAMQAGMKYVFTGNIRDPDGQATYCHDCGATLIGRDGYALTMWGLDGQGHCLRCGTTCAGVFETEPGTWGNRRQGVHLARFHDLMKRSSE